MSPLDPLAARGSEPIGPAGRSGVSGTTPAAPAPPADDDGRVVPAADRELGDLLTPEERSFLARHDGGAFLTYGPDGRPSGRPPLPTGRRIDVKG